MADDKKAAASSQLWEKLADAPDAIAGRFGIDANVLSELRRLLVSEVLADNSLIEHRIHGRKYRFDKSRPLIEQLRLARSATQYWTSMDFDPTTATVARAEGPDFSGKLDKLLGSENGVPQPAADAPSDEPVQPTRIPVEVYMPSVDCWFEKAGRERLRALYSSTTASDAQESPAPTADVAPPPLGDKVEYNRARLSAWYHFRVVTWPPGKDGPTEEEDLQAARSAFDSVTREAVRKVRNEKAPEAWKKPGPRRPS
jgi:hypothetical protein